ncbi:MAG: hypothetical protein E6P95_01215 [Candidatus Moraniibacteriota bacterium]|nr:MAG: hypothetical protein E6P95_01215 [Candidatus Moranbacteria bacterium]
MSSRQWLVGVAVILGSILNVGDVQPVRAAPRVVPSIDFELATMPPDAPELLFEERAAIGAICKIEVWVERYSWYIWHGLRMITLRSSIVCVSGEDNFLVKIHCDFLKPGRCQVEPTLNLGFHFEVEKRLAASRQAAKK